MEFEWDIEKEEENIRIRQIDFGMAFFLFDDPRRVWWEDLRRDYGERRYNMFAQYEGRVFAMTYTHRGDRIGVISLRKANSREQRKYERLENH